MLIQRYFLQVAQGVVLALIVPFSLFVENAQAGSPENHLFRNLTLQDPILSQHHETILNQLNNGALTEAKISSEQLFDLLITDRIKTEHSPAENRNIAKAITNAALVQSIAGNQTTALAYFDKSITMVTRVNTYDPVLIDMLMGQAMAFSSLKKYDQATESLRRAQHIAHREDGVYSARQLPALAQLIENHLSQQQPLLADMQQRLNIRILQGAYGVGSEKMAIEMQNVGRYFARRGFSMPLPKESKSRLYDAGENIEQRADPQQTNLNRNRLFRNATNLFAQSISILERKYGQDSLILVVPLRELASINISQQHYRNDRNAKVAAERAHDIIFNHPDASASEIARSMVILADTYQLISNSQAPTLYQNAYKLLSEDDTNLALRDELFSGSIRLHPFYDIQAIVTKQPHNVEPGTPLYVKISYNISPQGSPYDIRVESGNIPNIYQKSSRLYIAKMKFRPRFEDGIPIKAESQMIKIPFLVAI